MLLALVPLNQEACVVQGLTTAANSIYVRVADNCPCVQYDTNTGAEVGVNSPCCGNVNHFDLSYFAFEKIAHPVRALCQAWGALHPQPLKPDQPLPATSMSVAAISVDDWYLAPTEHCQQCWAPKWHWSSCTALCPSALGRLCDTVSRGSIRVVCRPTSS